MRKNAETTAPTRTAADFVLGLTLGAVPDAVVSAAKDHFLDALGVGVAAASVLGAAALGDAVARLGTGGESTAFGRREPLPAAQAALLNGALVHSLEYDDTHMAAIVHGSAVAAPAALAVAERERASGADLLAAYIAGWEVFVRLGLAAPGAFQARGFQITAVGGSFVAALISGRLMGLTPKQAVAAQGIAGSQASGVFEYLAEGATVKFLHPGWAAHGGVVAAELARGGLTGPSSIYDGRFGFYRVFAGDVDAPERLRTSFADLGECWHLPEVALKAYPCCHYIHPFLEGLEGLMVDGLVPADIVAIRCRVPPEEAPIICNPWSRKQAPASGYDAKFSLPYCLAALSVDGRIDVDTFTTEPGSMALALAQRITWSPLEGTGFPERFAAEIEIDTVTGKTLRARVDDVRGGPARPLARAEFDTKFRSNARRSLRYDAVETVYAEMRGLEDSANLVVLAAALRDLG